jgi:multicomponent Na+:H+ antiporter subunit D
MTVLPSLPITIPLAGAVLCMLFRRNIGVQKAIALFTSFLILLTSLFIFAATKDGTIAVMNVGDWPAPFGITLAIDMLSSVMLLLVGLLGVGVSAYACFDLDEPRMQFGFFPLMLILLMGVNGAFVTGDLCNLYVWFEVLLTASFILLALGGEREQLAGSIKYVTLNLLSSALFLAGIGIIYGMAGTLNLAELAHLVKDGARGDLLTMVAIMFMMAFGIKAGMFPLYFWLPASYPTPPAAVTALFSGLLTKVGVYSMIRMFTLVFDSDPEFLHGLILVGAGLTMVSGVLAATAQYEMRKILAVHIVSQIGYILMGLGLFTELALTGSIIYLAHVIIVKTNLFLIAGAINRLKGTYDLHKLGGLYRERPGLSILFIISAMSLAGVPPLSGFFAKITLIIAGIQAESWVIVTVALGVSLLTLYSMTKIWAYVFWKPAPEPLPDLDPMPKAKWLVFLLPMVGYTAITIAMGVYAGPVFDYASEAAAQLMNPQVYIDAVLGSG